MKYNVFTEQKKNQIIAKYLESIKDFNISATDINSGNQINMTVGGRTFILDTSKNKEVNSRQVLSR